MIQDLLYIAVVSRTVAASIVSMSWVQDGVHDVEARAFRWMNNIASAEVASSVVSLGWVEDGIDEIEVKAIEGISYIDYGNAEVASSVVSLGWVEDGIDEIEVKAIEGISYIGYGNAEVASSVVSLGWVNDGVDDAEVDLIKALASIADKDAAEALRIVGMPFVETIEPPDISAINSLRRLAAFRPEAFVRVMSHRALQDGISDDLAPIVATLDGVAVTNPGLIDVLLDPTKVFLERRTTTLPLAGDTLLN